MQYLQVPHVMFNKFYYLPEAVEYLVTIEYDFISLPFLSISTVLTIPISLAKYSMPLNKYVGNFIFNIVILDSTNIS